MRGFLLLELMLALALACMTILGMLSFSLALPVTVSRAERVSDASLLLRTDLASTTVLMRSAFNIHFTAASTTHDIFTTSTSVDPLEDESFGMARSWVRWSDFFGTVRTYSLEAYIHDASTTDTVCDPFVSGDWNHPQQTASYPLTTNSILGNLAQKGLYTPSDISSTQTILAIAMASTSIANTPSLFFFSVHSTRTPVAVGGFDNATSSRAGYSAVALNGTTAFAGNAFGSASVGTCRDGISCAQLHIFSVPASGTPLRIATLTLSTSSPPYAQTVSGISAPVSALTYYRGFIYLGLQKTFSGSEFNIIDVRDPHHPKWVSGQRFGRTVTGITVRDDYAYVSSDDPSSELAVIDIKDPLHALIVGSWNAPGSATFGYGVASTVRPPYIRFGRSYTPNAPEFSLLDASDPTQIRLLQNIDSGTTNDPESVRDILTQDRVTFLLLSRRLEFWDTHTAGSMATFAPPYQLPPGSDGAALTCRDQYLYLVRTDTSGTGYLDMLRGS